MSVDVCVATFGRPDMLAGLLASLMDMKVAENLSFRIVVVDNDRTGSAGRTVQEAAARSRVTICYDVEPVPSIALARNRCVSHVEADCVAFVDDDEYVATDWLQELTDALGEFGADAVLGPVIPVLPESAPDWIRRGRFFEARRSPSGSQRSTGATGNALIRTEWLKRWMGPFNPDFGLTGGEDTDFFSRVHRAGGRLVWCDTALVYERVGKERVNVRYLARKAFRGGQGFARVMLPERGYGEKAGWLVSRIALISAALASAVVAAPFSRALAVRSLQKVCSNLGQLSAVTTYRFRDYAERHDPDVLPK